MRALPSYSRGLSALGISGENEEKQQHFCHCSSPFYSAACVGSLLSVALLTAFLVWSKFWRLLRLHGLIFRTVEPYCSHISFKVNPCSFNSSISFSYPCIYLQLIAIKKLLWFILYHRRLFLSFMVQFITAAAFY